MALLGYSLLGRSFMGILVGAVLGVLTPSAVVSFMQARRLHALQVQLPDALMIMASGVRSGFSFMRCLQLVAEEMKPPIGTEFGRKPEINTNTGRDHHPAVYSMALAGGPVKGGQVYGKSDEKAFRVDTDGVSPEDMNATLAAALGMDPDKEIHSPDGRPFTLGNHGKVLTKVV